MAFQREIEIDKERVTSFLKNALNKVMTEENPDLLNDLKKIFKRTIPFSKRMYVAAYLTKEMQGRFHGARRKKFQRCILRQTLIQRPEGKRRISFR